jgi:hypothetical protein
VADALQMVEDSVRQGQSLPADLQPALGVLDDITFGKAESKDRGTFSKISLSLSLCCQPV